MKLLSDLPELDLVSSCLDNVLISKKFYIELKYMIYQMIIVSFSIT